MEFSREDLTEAKRQMDSILRKLQKSVETFEAHEHAERYKSQITLARRRIQAVALANALIEAELAKR